MLQPTKILNTSKKCENIAGKLGNFIIIKFKRNGYRHTLQNNTKKLVPFILYCGINFALSFF